ncbi:RnfABCDGE type electron transport complex subunit B [Petroclostridium sp. X23]|uniref:RnfABCDGE type electron transport complex subunit B n=1 Tax=Petroclostridium sp. X23 TaxID=3045146 RepID=UPI0024ADD07D|nr:RnfABCDGE type electron transport complex subunit B [Petroclostridium sp. X23]WHH59989.1 RnfABCDGE type electron transport complex subunit B [Petroclostridium sp. X23]
MSEIFLVSLAAMGGTGILFGVLITYTSKKFAVQKDERIGDIEKVLPGANCGACGYPGCSAYAEAIVAEGVSITMCPVGGASVASQVGQIMGIQADDSSVPMVARVKCGGGKNCIDSFAYRGIQDCHAANALHKGFQACKYGCLGLGNCVVKCPFDAIIINQNGVAEIDENKCTGCGVCIKECPKAVIELASKDSKVHVLCKNLEKGKDVRQKCKTGCIACKLCEKACQYGAIKVENNVAVIDYSKCTNCNACVQKCPTRAIANLSDKLADAACDKCVI